MIANLQTYITIAFGLTTFLTLILFTWILRNAQTESTRKKSFPILIGLICWLIIQATLTINNYYNTETLSFPPKIMLFGILPPLLLIVLLFFTTKGKEFIDSLPLKNITYLNIVRMPVELVLFWLFLNKAVPELMTFEGRNFDILAGISAPFAAYFTFKNNKIGRKGLLIWNFICLALLANIVTIALLSAPSPIQKLAFDQPNIAILNFPFSWLPTFVVPIVFFGHLVSIGQLMKYKK